MHRAETTVTEPSDLAVEKGHIKSALKNCGYQDWIFSNSDRKSERTPEVNQRVPTDTKITLLFPIFRASLIRYAELTQESGDTYFFQTSQDSSLVFFLFLIFSTGHQGAPCFYYTIKKNHTKNAELSSITKNIKDGNNNKITETHH